MKPIKLSLLAGTLCLISFFAFGQKSKGVVPGISENGYWVIETNVKTPLTNTIHFYNNNNELVYQETLEGVKLNINRKKIRIKLQAVLETALLAWQKNKKADSDKDYVKVSLR